MHNEKKSLSLREKRMLLWVTVIALLAIMVQFVILPLSRYYSDNQDTIAALETRKTDIDLKLSTEQSVRVNHTAALERYEEISADILGLSQSNEIGRMLTTLCQNHRLTPTNQRLTEPKTYVLVKTEVNPETGERSERKEDTSFLTVSVVMNVTGGYNELNNLLDFTDNIPYIRITRISFTRNAVSETSYEMGPVTIEFEVTMLSNE